MGTLIVSTVQTQNIKADANTTAMTINAAGSVLKPELPFWRLRGPTNAETGSTAALGTILFTAHTSGDSTGGGVTHASGVVTVPTTGLYQINVHINARSENASYTHTGIAVQVNGADIDVRNYAEADVYTRWRDVSFSSIVPLNANDTIKVINNYTTHSINIDGNSWTGFTGYLIG